MPDGRAARTQKQKIRTEDILDSIADFVLFAACMAMIINAGIRDAAERVVRAEVAYALVKPVGIKLTGF